MESKWGVFFCPLPQTPIRETISNFKPNVVCVTLIKPKERRGSCIKTPQALIERISGAFANLIQCCSEHNIHAVNNTFVDWFIIWKGYVVFNKHRPSFILLIYRLTLQHFSQPLLFFYIRHSNPTINHFFNMERSHEFAKNPKLFCNK